MPSSHSIKLTAQGVWVIHSSLYIMEAVGISLQYAHVWVSFDRETYERKGQDICTHILRMLS